MILLRSTVALLWTAISVVQVSSLLHIVVSLAFKITCPLLGRRFLGKYDLCHLAQIPELESSPCVG